MAQETAAEPTARKRSETARAFAEDGPRKTHVGGQALIEGVMMRGKFNWAVAVREPDGGMYVEEHDLASGRAKNGWMHLPVVRGCRAFVESLMLGYKALEIAAMHAFADEDGDGDVGSAGGGSGSSAALSGADASATRRSAAQDPSDPSCAALLQSDELMDGVQTVAPASAPERAAVSSGADVTAPVEDAAFSSSEQVTASPGGEERKFSWKDDFGNPDEMIDALGAQRTLEVVCASEPEPAEDRDGSAGSVGEEGPSDEGFGKKEMAVSMVLGLVLGVVLFIVAPAFITNLVVGEYDSNPVLWNIFDGVLRVLVFIFYIWLIGRMEEIKRMFSYHGAEHKTIHCYEHGMPLTPANARSFPRLHVRCGTAFLIMVMIIAIFVYTAIPLDALIGAWGVPDGAPKLALVIFVRILFLPVIAGISYEITVKWAGSHPENPLVKVVLWPGMQMQRLTTKEPDDGMLECAIAAMQCVLDREEAEAARSATA